MSGERRASGKPAAGDKPIRVVVIDDSAYNRQTITSILEQTPGIAVVGRAGDGEEGLRLVFQTQPDVITLDLEMPKMDGFSFLRILMSKRPTPVLVISGHATRDNVFKALELGALDFIAKPARHITSELRSIAEELTHKVRLATQLRMVSLTERALRAITRTAESAPISLGPSPARRDGAAPPHLVAIGASTGGPPAIQQLLAALEPGLPMGIIITQHMPAKFTRAFAERLERTTPWTVREAEPGDAVCVGTALVAPGSGSLVVSREGAQLKASIVGPTADDRFVPSIDRMLDSAARAMGRACLAVVLTGMGGDAGRGAAAVKAAGGRVLVEAPETAVIYGMPQEAINAGAADDIVPLPSLPQAIIKFVRR